MVLSPEEGSAAVALPSSGPRQRRRGIGWPARLEIAVLSGPAIIIFLTFVIMAAVLAVRPRGLLGRTA